MQSADSSDEFGPEDAELDRLLAELPLPLEDDPSRKRKDIPGSSCYEPIAFGEIGQYMKNKRAKLKIQEEALRGNVEPTKQFMAGLVIHVNGYTNPPQAEIRKLIVIHGGTYMAYLDRKSTITHIIATSLTPKKHQEFRLYKVVTPEWIVDSVAVGKLLNWSDYKLDKPTQANPNRRAGHLPGGLPSAQRTLFPLNKHPFTHSPTSLASGNTPSVVVKDTRNGRYIPTPPFTITPSSSITSPFPIDADLSTPSAQPTTSDSPLSPSLPPEDPLYSTIADSNAQNFIQEYFQQSRLHHLSTWKSNLLQKISGLSSSFQKTGQIAQKKRLVGDESDGRIILHVDFDCFFISAGLISRPELTGKPVAVCHAQGTGAVKSTSEVASCSYEARSFGVKNGMMLGRARDLCPQIHTIPYDFKLYEDISLKFYNILLGYADELQAVSVDECLLDISTRIDSSTQELSKDNRILELADKIRTEIRQETRCEASIGISHNILLSKLATKKAKPAGSFYLRGSSQQISEILSGLDIDDLPGVGSSQKTDIEKTFKVSNVGQLAKIPLSKLVEAMGPLRGKTLHLYSRGIDDRPLKSGHHDRKSVSVIVNYGIRFKKSDDGGKGQARTFIKELGVEVSRRLVDLGLQGRHLTVKIMKRAAGAPIETAKFLGHGICDDLSKAIQISGPGGQATDDAVVIGDEAWKLVSGMDIPSEDLRGIGIQIQKLQKKDGRGDSGKGQQSTLMFKPVKQHQQLALIPGHGNIDAATGFQTARPNPPVKMNCREPIASTSENVAKQASEDLPSSQLVIPSSSQIDPEVLDALPTPMRANIINSTTRHDVTPVNKPRQPSSSLDQQLPSASQIDWAILAELPSSIRQPIEALYEQRKRQRSNTTPPPSLHLHAKVSKTAAFCKSPKINKLVKTKTKATIDLRLVGKPPRVSRKAGVIKSVGPSQRLISKTSFKLITLPQPLKPSSDVDNSQNLANAMLPTPDRITDEQLAALEIDVRFFRDLSSARSFQLDLIYDQYQTHKQKFHEVTAAGDRWRKWRKRFGQASKVLSVQKVVGPSLACKSMRGGVRSFEEVSRLIEEWVETYEFDDDGGIDLQDVTLEDAKVVERFLVQCIDKSRGSGQELEKVFKLVVWWEEAVRKKMCSHGTDGYAAKVRDMEWERWERLIARVKGQIDLICERDHGACLFG